MDKNFEKLEKMMKKEFGIDEAMMDTLKKLGEQLTPLERRFVQMCTFELIGKLASVGHERLPTALDLSLGLLEMIRTFSENWTPEKAKKLLKLRPSKR